MTLSGKTEFIQLVGLIAAGLGAVVEDRNNIPGLLRRMKEDGNVDLVTDMQRQKSYF